MPAPIRPFARTTLAALGRVRLPDPVAATMTGSASSGPRHSASSFPYSWDSSYPARVGVMAREGSDTVRWFDVNPCYVYHGLNAYEDGETIVVDVARHSKTFATEHRGPAEGPPTLDRWTIDLTANKVIEDRLDDRGQEFPRIDERLTGRRHRYGYTVGVGATDSDCVIKHDLVGGGVTVRSLGPAGSQASEFVFVPRNATSGEDDGVLMGFAYDASTDRSDLTILDAQTLEPVAAVHLPTRVPQGFHGNWAPTA
jgi:carotenoid cleavage dioxygenase